MTQLISKQKHNMGNLPLKVLIVALILSMILMTVWAIEGTSGPIHSVRNAISVVTVPIQRAGTIISVPFTALNKVIERTSASENDIIALREQNEELRSMVAELEEYKEENSRLTALLELRDMYSLTSTGARVILVSDTGLEKTITIDKGSSNGVYLNMPVLNSTGLLGQVTSVNATSSEVTLITDSTSGVSATIQGSRTQGIVKGSVDGTLYLEYVATTTAGIEIGDMVVTSGLGGVYPKGLVIGEISNIEGNEADLYYTITVEPVTSAELSEEVIVVTDISETSGDE